MTPVGQVGGAVGQRVGVGVGRVGVEADGVADGVLLRSGRSVLKTGAQLTIVTGGRGDRRAGGGAVVDGHAHADQVALVAVAGEGEVERAARGAGDVEEAALADELVVRPSPSASRPATVAVRAAVVGLAEQDDEVSRCINSEKKKKKRPAVDGR